MKKVTLIILTLALVCLSTHAQTIKGILTDINRRPVEFATIVLQTKDSTFINSTYSDTLGHFSFSEYPTAYRLLIQHLRYVSIDSVFSSVEVGTLMMKNKDLNLTEVLVEGEHPLVRVIDGKLTYDMPQLLQNKMASNAYDAILELPGVYQQNESIQLAGSSSVTVILNGKPSTMTSEQLTTLLKNMPKERIETAEVTYSAPPQYHVRGAVINLRLTSSLSNKPQLQGQVNASYKQSHYDSYQVGATWMYSTPKTSTDLMYQFGYTDIRTQLDLYSKHTYKDKMYAINQYNKGRNTMPIHNIRLANDYYMNSTNKLSLAYVGQIKAWGHVVENSKGTFSNSINKKETDSPIQMHNLSVDYTSGFGLSAGIDNTFFSSRTTQNYRELTPGKESSFSSKAKQDISRYSFYIDQSHNLEKDWTLEYGTRFSYASDKSSQTYTPLSDENFDTTDTNTDIDEYTASLYAGFTKELTEKLTLKAHLTTEYYKHHQRGYWSFFPDLELTYVPSASHIIQYALASNKVYPSYWEMIDAVGHINGYSEIHGNPNLKAYREYEMQLNYIVKNKYIFSLSGSYQDDYFAQLPYQSSQRLAIIYQTTNFDYNSKIQLNAILPFRIGRVMDSKLTWIGFYHKVKSSNFHDLSFNNDLFSYVVILNNTFNLSSKPNIKAELSAIYTPKNIQGPSTLHQMYKVDAGLKWTSNNAKAEIRFVVNDIFNRWSEPRRMITQFANQDIEMQMLPDSRHMSISFSYKFGGYKEKKNKEVDTSRFGSK